MNKVLNEKLINQILSVVACIPVGKVATYGQITHLIGRERNARCGQCSRTLSASVGGAETSPLGRRSDF